MAKSAGRDLLVKMGGTTIAGVRQKSIARNSTPIDCTTDNDAEYASFLADEFSEDTLEITVSGLEDGTTLRDIAFTTNAADRHLSDLTLEYPGAPTDTISGNFMLTAYTVTGSYQEATTFDATFVRNGQHTFTQGV